MISRFLTLTTSMFLLLSVTSCSTVHYNDSATPRTLLSDDSEPAKATVKAFPGADSQSVEMMPIITPPEVMRVWIYDHLTPSRDLVIGHWVFLELAPAKWYIEQGAGGPVPSSQAMGKRIPFTTQPPKVSEVTH